MTKVYACLVGKWVCLNDDDGCVIGENHLPPAQWWKEDAQIYAPFKPDRENSLYSTPYVNISYKGKDYRINPMFIQIVSEPV